MAVAWDPDKDLSNQEKHGVSFEEAAQLLTSAIDFLEIYDEAHSNEEDRLIAVGPIDRGVIVVVSTERDDGVLRIVSARMATKNERRRYDDHAKARQRK